MRKILIVMCLALTLGTVHAAVVENPQSVCEMLDRIGGHGTSKRIITQLDQSLATVQGEFFILTSQHGKPCIKGSSISAITTGIGWYLNHIAHVNLSWNNAVRTRLTDIHLPIPVIEERHKSDADYRYYLNYCTFGYSMTTWDWERWQQEIDWMALHGINMPLQIIGLETVWRNFLIEDCHYSETRAEAFIPGPAYTAWWGMNNLEGWGGDAGDHAHGVTDNAWYQRQADLASRIVEREHALGMQPVLPGFSGMMPSNFPGAESQGKWCQFQRPYIMDPSNPDFQNLAAAYYRQLAKVMGHSKYYSMDPFHEGGLISSGKYSDGYTAIFRAMNNNCGHDSQWVIQQWQWGAHQRTSLNSVPAGRLIVLDLFSDGDPKFDSYQGYAPQHAVYCAIPNFGGRTGFFGRIPKMADNYFTYKSKYSTIRGIGAAPEAIEQTPVVYDLLFELPWTNGQKPDCDQWICDYALARYGCENRKAAEAWLLLLHSALNNTTTLQGPHEAVVCGRPSLRINAVSTWGGTHIFYNPKDMQQAAWTLLEAGAGKMSALGRENYSFDLCDIARQAVTDYSQELLDSIRVAHEQGNQAMFQTQIRRFLSLILDLDVLLGTNRMFRLGNWTQTARKAAAEVQGATTATPDWYELYNARQLITTWGGRDASERAGLRDYSYRQWQGMLSDFYYPRWQYYFSHNLQAPQDGWFPMEWRWAHDASVQYTAKPAGNTRTEAARILKKYLPIGN